MAVLTEDQKGLEVSIKMLEEACKAYGMKVNAKKTKILHIDDAQTDQLWQVNLTLIGNGNHDSNMFTSYLRHQLIPFNGWSRLGLIFIQVGESSKAEYLYKILLDKASSDKEQVEYHHQLEIVYNSMGEYLKALSSYQRSIEILSSMKLTISILSIFFLITTIGAPPVGENVNKNKKTVDSKEDSSDEALNNLEYSRYLKEVVEILENDPEFKKKLENASLDDIKSGNIAQHLGLVQHHVRTKLDEAKQREMDRLRELVGRRIRNLSEKERMELARGSPNGKNIKDLLPQHIDHQNSENFAEADLERLIRHASKDLDEIDRQREREFKEYEMRKEFERRAKLAQMNEEERKKQETLHQEAVEKKKHHPKVNHPGSVDQMEEVWEDVDHLEADQFNSKSFFKLHDVNSDGFLDEGEIEAIMLKEAEKIHENTPEADPIEKQEEMDRMREHVMKEFDKNNDRMLSFDEFEHGINGTEAKNDQGWQSLEDSTPYSDQEFQNFSDQLIHAPEPDASQPRNPPPANAVPSSPQEHIPRAPASMNSH
ncbi:unnamed protein product [Rotaria magnacalcarata]|uniref:EF-hand domain-containing protein n=2 Tax=Rotaria magnacalcarata TaxID=392030 RepID=A0A8S2N9A5_9BILA|nr:unnamed protein product [Rotaria magnacalcarata]